jgi:hypothetical protein
MINLRLLICLIFVASSASAGQVNVFGRADDLLQPQDIAQIAAQAKAELFAVEVDWAQTLPEEFIARVFLKPTSDSDGVRQGRSIELRSRVRNNRASQWRVTSKSDRYAQVAVAKKPFTEQIRDRNLDRPFVVFGSFTDSELRHLVDFIRTSPRKPPIPDLPDGTRTIELDQLNGDKPVVQVQRLTGSRIAVWLADDSRSGMRAELEYKAGNWIILEVSLYVS